MLIDFDPTAWKYESEHHVCAHHQEHPEDRSWPGCTCSGIVRMVRKEPMEGHEASPAAVEDLPPDVAVAVRTLESGVARTTERTLRARIEALEEALQDYVKWHSYCNASTRYAAPHHHDPIECGECRMRAEADALLSTKEDDHE